jgi:hypothetical protein
MGCSVPGNGGIVDDEQPAPIRLEAGGFGVPAFSPDLPAVGAALLHDPFAVQHDELGAADRSQRLQVDGGVRPEGLAICLTDGVDALGESVTTDENGPRFVQRDDCVQVVTIERLLELDVKVFGRFNHAGIISGVAR